jgi:hypothetical protein
MKKLIIIFVLFISINTFSQDTTTVKRFSLCVGPTWGTLGWCGNANLSYALSKKFNIKLRGIYSFGKNFTFTDQSYYAGIRKTPTTDLSVSANYFLFGNTNHNCKAALYIGLGLGYLQEINTTTYLYPGNLFSSNNPMGSYIEKEVSRVFAANSNMGAAFKLGPGKLFVEAYFSISFVGEETLSFTFMNQFTTPTNPPKLQVNKYKESFDPEGVLCFNVGYIIPF